MKVIIYENNLTSRVSVVAKINSAGRATEEIKRFLGECGLSPLFLLGVEINDWRIIFSSDQEFKDQIGKFFAEAD